MAQGLGGSGGEHLGGLWVLPVSVAALRTVGLPKALDWFGVAIGAAGVVSVVPALSDVAYGFGSLQILWFAWLGIVMLRTTSRQAEPAGIAVTDSDLAAANSTPLRPRKTPAPQNG